MQRALALLTRTFLTFLVTGMFFQDFAAASQLSVTTGQSVQLAVSAQGTQPFTYQWRKNGTAISTATGATYSLAAVSTADAGSYSVAISNSAGSTVSDNATLTVTAAALIAPSITTQPTSRTVTSGQSTTFSVAASGSATLAYQWNKNGTAISGATNANFTIAAVTSADAASYTVVVTNSAGSATSNAASLTVNAALIAPSITTQPTSRTVTAGQSTSFSVAASGSATLTYQWKKNGTSISGATSATFTIAAVTSADAASYTVVVTNSAGSATSNAASLTVTAAAVAPSITTQPTSLSVDAGQPASFSAAASGTATLYYQWRKNGTAISGATNSTYTIATATTTDAASYSVVVNNTAGSVTSNSATLTVNAAPSLVQLTPQTVSARGQNSPIEGIAQLVDGNTATKWLDFSATTWVKVVFASPTVLQDYSLTSANDVPTRDPASWTLSGSNDGTTWTVIESRTSQSWASRFLTRDFVLAKPSTAFTQFRFDLVAASGSITQLAELEMYGLVQPYAPTIITQPASLALKTGQSASFSVTATGSGTLAYQWRKNGTVISGATSASYTISGATSADAASYSVVVSNSAGSVTSSSATLMVNATTSLVQLTAQTISARGQNSPVEGIAQLVDGNTATKWLDFAGTTWVKVVFGSPTVLQAYSLTSANDFPERDPASWTLSGSNDGTTWTVIESRTGQSWASRFLTRDFALTTPSAAFTQFRFDLVATSGSITQLAELEIYGSNATSGN